MIVKTLVFVTLIGLSFGATLSEPATEKDAELAHQEGHYMKEIHAVIPPPARATPIGHCLGAECDNCLLNYASCGLTMTPPGCQLVEQDLMKPYPDCCPKLECDEDKNV